MKKFVSLMLALVLMLSCVSLIACSGEEKEEAAPPPAGEATPAPKPEAEAAPLKEEAPSAGPTWDDIPIYPGASQLSKSTYKAGDQGTLESRTYETKDGAEKVIPFYRAEMPKKGWQELRWMDIEKNVAGGGVWGWPSKKDGEITANISIIEEKGKTRILIQLLRPAGTPESEAEAAPPPEAPPSGGHTWDEIPIYPGAMCTQTLTHPNSQHGFYETEDELEEVASFYRAEMPKKGWRETAWIEAGEAEETAVGGVWEWPDKKEGGIRVTVSIHEDERKGKTSFDIARIQEEE